MPRPNDTRFRYQRVRSRFSIRRRKRTAVFVIRNIADCAVECAGAGAQNTRRSPRATRPPERRQPRSLSHRRVRSELAMPAKMRAALPARHLMLLPPRDRRALRRDARTRARSRAAALSALMRYANAAYAQRSAKGQRRSPIHVRRRRTMNRLPPSLTSDSKRKAYAVKHQRTQARRARRLKRSRCGKDVTPSKHFLPGTSSADAQNSHAAQAARDSNMRKNAVSSARRQLPPSLSAAAAEGAAMREIRRGYVKRRAPPRAQEG